MKKFIIDKKLLWVLIAILPFARLYNNHLFWLLYSIQLTGLILLITSMYLEKHK